MALSAAEAAASPHLKQVCPSKLICAPSGLSHSYMWIMEGTWPEVTATSEALAEPAQKCEVVDAPTHVPLSAGMEWGGGSFTPAFPTCPSPLCLLLFWNRSLELSRNAALGSQTQEAPSVPRQVGYSTPPPPRQWLWGSGPLCPVL